LDSDSFYKYLCFWYSKYQYLAEYQPSRPRTRPGAENPLEEKVSFMFSELIMFNIESIFSLSFAKFFLIME